MLSDLQKALVADQRLQITVWDPDNDAVEYSFSSVVVQSAGTLFQVANPETDDAEILPLLKPGVILGMVVETYPNPFVFYPVVHLPPEAKGIWLRVPDNAQIEMIGGRRHVRIPMEIPIQVEHKFGAHSLTASCRTEDISGGGLRFVSSRQFEAEQQVVCRVRLSEALGEMVLPARVVYSMKNRRARQPDELFVTACQFLNLDSAKENLIVRECFRWELGHKR